MKSSPHQITTHIAGWRIQFRFAGNVFWSGGYEFRRYARCGGDLPCARA
jgi:hypothetical protein